MKLWFPPTSKKQTGCRKGRGREGRGREERRRREEGEKGGSFSNCLQILPQVEVQLSIAPYPFVIEPPVLQLPPYFKPPLTSCSVSVPPWSAHSAALITNCHLPSVNEAGHLLQEKANTLLSMARCTHNWSSTVRLYRGRVGKAGGQGLVMEWRDVCTVNLGLLAKLQELAIHC